MALLPVQPTTDPTLVEADLALERNQDRSRRAYLGASQLGDECERKLFYSFRWAHPIQFDALTLKRFADGHASESIMADRLRAVPSITLHTVDPQTGEQFRITDWNGNFSGHLDGAIVGLLQAPKTWHVWEHKAVGEATFSAFEKVLLTGADKGALKEWNPTYYAQAVLYMDYTGMTRHYLTVSDAGSRRTLSVRTDADPDFAKQLREKAGRIIKANAPPQRISDDPTWWKCRGCSAHAVCHGTKMPEVNCRTCTHSEPAENGNWNCLRHNTTRTPMEQQKGCEQHTYLPTLLAPYGLAVMDTNDGSVTYMTKGMRVVTIGPGEGAMPSTDAQHLTPAIVDEMLDAIARFPGARPVPANEPPPAGTFQVSGDQVLRLMEREAINSLSDMARRRLNRGEAAMSLEGNSFVTRDKKTGEALK